MKRTLLSLFVVLGLCSPAFAQFDTASVVGTVRDNSGAVVGDATVTLTNVETGVTLTKTTDGQGNFEFFTVRIGTYVVTAEKQGFAVAVADNVNVAVGARQRVDLSMQVGQLSERVEVTAAATRLETDTSQRGQVITGSQTRALPLNGREYSTLALLTTGVRVSSIGTGSNANPREGSFNVNGLRSTANNFLIDGVDNNAYGTSNQGFSNQVMQPSPDAVAEFKVVTNNMSAEYGRSAGATINVAYQSGTNRFKGSAWEFFRDTSLNATGFFKPASGEKPPLERNQFGGVFGGPILKNRAFFFADYEGLRQTRGQPAFSTIPNMTQRQGILSVDVRNPITGAVYPAGTPIPMTAFARKVLTELPEPTSAAASNNYAISQEFENTTDKMAGKVDFTFSPKLSAFGRYGYRDVDIFDQPTLPLPSGGAGNAQTYVTNKQLALGTTYVPSGTSLLEFRFGWSRTVAGKNPAALVEGLPSAQDAYGITGLPSDPRVSGGLPTQLITGYSDLGRQATNPQWQYPTVYNPKVNYTWLVGAHSLKSGYEFQHVQTEVQDVNPLYGRDQYSGQFSRVTGAANNLYNLADFMLGLRSTFALSNILVANLRQNMHFAYLQDDFRVNDKLTLNLGLRYEYATPWVEKDNILSNWDPETRRMVIASGGSLQDRSTLKPDKNNFGPRLGAAWTVSDKTVARGGYGVSYVHFHRAGGANVLPINGPQVINAVVVQSPTDATFVRTEQGYPAGLTDPSRFNPLAANITFMPEDYHSTRVQSWFASVQRELGSNMIVDLAYVGNRADGNLLFANFNQAVPNNAAGTLPLQARRPIPEFADITYSWNGGKSRYHAFQGKFDWRMRQGLSLLSSLTLSQTKDNGSGSLENPNGNFPAPQDFRNLDAEYGLSAYHQPFNSTTSFVWDLPFGRDRSFMSNANPVVEAVLGGWQVAGINTIYAGEMVTLIYTPAAAFQVSGIQQDFRGANNYRPNLTGDPLTPKNERGPGNYLNRNTVVLPTDPSQPFGNAPRNNVRAPMFWQVDFVANKRFAMPWPQGSVELRLEAFNLFNHTNFRAPNGNRSAAAFGTITSTYDPRQVQLGVKVNF
jgi:hypothetical protein